MRKTGLRAVAVLALVAGPVLLPVAPASAGRSSAADVFVEINPSTVQAGELVGVRASCEENITAATVKSDAFGTVAVHPQYGFLTATATVPENTEADSYEVALTCNGGGTALSTLHVLARNRPTQGPATGFGGLATGGGSGAYLLGGGLAAIAAAAVLGLATLRRRRSDA